MRRWIWIAVIGCPLLYVSYKVWSYFHPEPEYRLESSTFSPSGRWRVQNYSVWMSTAFTTFEWSEIRLTDIGRKGTPQRVLLFSLSEVGLAWPDQDTLLIKAENRMFIGERIKRLGDANIEILFEPDDPNARRDRLIEHKIPKDDWWMYDIPLD